jgi:redox-sensitive bicupin YhaK (pirin superfamily)
MKKVAFVKRSNGSHWVGDGFPVRSIFSYQDVAAKVSPFLLLDYGGPTSFEPTGARRGVGAHPHRGFETVTIVYDGEVSHRDSSGGGGTIGPGDVQWMTAGRGIVHEEFHGEAYARRGGPFEMVQLWVNLPARDKLAPPAYQGITDASIPRVDLPGDTGSVRVIAGSFTGVKGPARTFTPMNVYDLRAAAGASLSFDVPEGHTTALLVLAGGLDIGGQAVGPAEMAVLEREGTQVAFKATAPSKVLVLSGEPIDEPIVGYGPFVMNTREEIVQAIDDFQSGRMGALA